MNAQYFAEITLGTPPQTVSRNSLGHHLLRTCTSFVNHVLTDLAVQGRS
jgi:hypothetical protein